MQNGSSLSISLYLQIVIFSQFYDPGRRHRHYSHIEIEKIIATVEKQTKFNLSSF